MKGRECIHISERRWYAIKVKFKAEKFVAEQLERSGIIAYVPLLERRQVVRSQVRQTVVPLIHNYAFVQIRRAEYLTVLQTMHVFGFVNIGGAISAIPDEEMNLMRRIVGSGASVDIKEGMSLEIGQPVQIIAGELTGLHGMIVDQSNKKNFIVELEKIGMHMRLSIDASQVLPLTVAV